MNFAVVLAGGKSERFGVSKQFFLVHEKPLLYYSLNIFNNSSLIDEIILVHRPEEEEVIHQLAQQFNKVKTYALCGETREESVLHGLQAIKQITANDKVLIHDGARPLVSENLIARLIAELSVADGVIPVVAMDDSIINTKELNYVNRADYKRVQTPQAFVLEKILKVFNEHFEKDATDEGSMFLKHYVLHYVDGEKQNIKVTTKEDITLIESYLNK